MVVAADKFGTLSAFLSGEHWIFIEYHSNIYIKIGSDIIYVTRNEGFLVFADVLWCHK